MALTHVCARTSTLEQTLLSNAHDAWLPWVIRSDLLSPFFVPSYELIYLTFAKFLSYLQPLLTYSQPLLSYLQTGVRLPTRSCVRCGRNSTPRPMSRYRTAASLSSFSLFSSFFFFVSPCFVSSFPRALFFFFPSLFFLFFFNLLVAILSSSLFFLRNY